jgi:uncharacterized membrane protein SirB2
MNAYLIAKHIHQLTAVVFAASFVIRGLLMLANSAAGRARWVTIATHVNDTVLLVSALYLAFMIGFQDWVIAKLVGLAVVVVLGIVALKRGRTRGIRGAAFVAALAVIAYIAAVAVTKRVVPF